MIINWFLLRTLLSPKISREMKSGVRCGSWFQLSSGREKGFCVMAMVATGSFGASDLEVLPDSSVETSRV